MASAQRRAEKQQKERDDRTGKRYLKQAKNLDSQASALKKALGEMKERRKQDIQDITRTRDTQLADIASSATELGKTYTVAGENNEAATAATQESGMANLVRERQDALGQILTQGAGESDTLKAMLIAARNQNANAAEGNRAFYDTLASINQGVVGLNEDTKTKLSNAWIAGEGEKEQIWRDYLEARGEALTQLGQVRTAQADAYANAEEYEAKIPRLGKNKKAKKKKLKNTKGSGTGFSKAASLSSSNKLIGISGTGKKMRKGKPGTPADKLRRRQAGNAFDDWAELQDESYEQKEAPDWINYDLPAEMIGIGLKGKFRGQTQKWFAFRFTGDESEIQIDPPPDGHDREFEEWAWLPMADLPELIVPFKRQVYEEVVRVFRHLAGVKAA